ncbi:hypothetical protein [Candidatus Poriferisocius sp.]|uniref:restriction system modified-DNA reader domain-containing protein n=1 Tax=Candidatus Poriferisocius sp. TaxID=3101276 RepID=UPI003B01B2AB
MIRNRDFLVKDLIDEGLLQAGAKLTWDRKEYGVDYWAEVLDTGKIKLLKSGIFEFTDNLTCNSPSEAAKKAANTVAAQPGREKERILNCNGWEKWCTDDGKPLIDLRKQYFVKRGIIG